MTVNLSTSAVGFSRRIVVALFVAALFLGLAAPLSARAAEVSAVDTLQIAVSLESTSTTVMTMTIAVPDSVALPATLNFDLPGGYTIMDQGEFDSNPAKPTAGTKAVKGETDEAAAMTAYSVTLTKSHHFFCAAVMPVSIYSASAMGNGGVPLAVYTIRAATDIKILRIGIKPPAANMVGAGGSSTKSFDAGNGVLLYGQEYSDLKKGDTKSVQVAFASQQQAQQGQDSAKQKAGAAVANGFFAQPIVWVVGAVLIIVVIILVWVLARQRRGIEPADERDDDDVDFDEDEDDETDDEDVAAASDS
ncbi:MAG: hypothetical protein FWC54_02335 [Actinomycetia bacterium]|nr:hypothetical protein [Actinomycetes bacterium]